MAIPTYANFGDNTNHLSQAKKAFNEVRLLLGKANSALVNCPNDPSEQDRFVVWFGQYTDRIQLRYHRLGHGRHWDHTGLYAPGPQLEIQDPATDKIG